ncbi:MAG: 1,4-beta-xylanase, partial [Lachnospiraceae bacterium]|nr:1,4-beta-xylanase [Lachnospiraceae bacterium]
ACPGAEFNVYADGVYVGDSPLGPFTLAANNPYSYHPGGFMPGAGHGSTMQDRNGNWWHTSTMRISVNHQFERRVGIWPAGFDRDGELFCNQNYGDWPVAVDGNDCDPWREPQWYLLNYKKPAAASSCAEGSDPGMAVNEDARTWWRAASAERGQWLVCDLEKVMDVRAVQINFADDRLPISSPGAIQGSATQPRYIEEQDHVIRWILEGSQDGTHYFVIEDKSGAGTDLPHDFVVREEGIRARFVKLTILQIPYDVAPCISGLRIFGIGDGEKPRIPEYRIQRSGDRLDLLVDIENTADASGYNILWGHAADKLYHSYQVYKSEDALTQKRIGALVAAQEYFVRVDAFNENGITHGKVMKL